MCMIFVVRLGRCNLDRPVNKRVNPHPYAPAQLPLPLLCVHNRNYRLFRSAIVSFLIIVRRKYDMKKMYAA